MAAGRQKDEGYKHKGEHDCWSEKWLSTKIFAIGCKKGGIICQDILDQYAVYADGRIWNYFLKETAAIRISAHSIEEVIRLVSMVNVGEETYPITAFN